jgi:hypothetical protein
MGDGVYSRFEMFITRGSISSRSTIEHNTVISEPSLRQHGLSEDTIATMVQSGSLRRATPDEINAAKLTAGITPEVEATHTTELANMIERYRAEYEACQGSAYAFALRLNERLKEWRRAEAEYLKNWHKRASDTGRFNLDRLHCTLEAIADDIDKLLVPVKAAVIRLRGITADALQRFAKSMRQIDLQGNRHWDDADNLAEMLAGKIHDCDTHRNDAERVYITGQDNPLETYSEDRPRPWYMKLGRGVWAVLAFIVLTAATVVVTKCTERAYEKRFPSNSTSRRSAPKPAIGQARQLSVDLTALRVHPLASNAPSALPQQTP